MSHHLCDDLLLKALWKSRCLFVKAGRRAATVHVAFSLRNDFVCVKTCCSSKENVCVFARKIDRRLKYVSAAACLSNCVHVNNI